MNATKLMAKIEQQRLDGEKYQVLAGLNALLLTTPVTRGRARSYIEDAIAFIERGDKKC